MASFLQRTIVAFIILGACLRAAEEREWLLQGFEGNYRPSKWPHNGKGEVVVSKQWKVEGEHALKLDPGLATSIEALNLSDWTGYSLLRLHFFNPGEEALNVGFELYDPKSDNYWDRHINVFGIQPGLQTVDVDFSAGLWRSENNAPYRGKYKTPIETDKISRFALSNCGKAPVLVDKIQLIKVKKLATPGGFAFQFGKPDAMKMSQYTHVNPSSTYTPEKRYGFMGGQAFGLHTAASYPTPLLGGGLSFPASGFRVDLPGGKYRAWIAFERGGFWPGEQCGYSKATLRINGTAVHEHSFSPGGPHFYFQDTEVTDLAEVNEKLIWPAHAITTFEFNAVEGANLLTLETTAKIGMPLRVAGIVLAPDTDEGKAFVAAHDQLQRKAIATTFAAQDRSRRGNGRSAPAKPLVVEPLWPGDAVFPGDWPSNAGGALLPDKHAIAGQTVTFHLGVYASRAQVIKVQADPLQGPVDAIADITVSYGRYLPSRPYLNGAMFLEINHYRPDREFQVGPKLSRSLVVEYAVPSSAKAGVYSGEIKLISGGQPALILPVKITVASVKLAEFPVPVGLLSDALPFGPTAVGLDRWWELQEQALKEQIQSGLNVVSGGPGLEYRIDSNGRVSGENAVRYTKLAQKYGKIQAIIPYGGFLPSLRQIKADFKTLAAELAAFEAANQLPPNYLYAYDEPATDEAVKEVLPSLAAATEAGLKTLGFTSAEENNPWREKLILNTYAPVFNGHTAKDLEKVKAAGRHFCVYNNGLHRYGMGLHLWRNIKLGAEARLQYIGMVTQGFSFFNLDGRQPSYGCLLPHDTLGLLRTPAWLSVREGLLDARIRLTLERLAAPDDPALSVWTMDGYGADADKWPGQELERAREQMLKRIQELSGK